MHYSSVYDAVMRRHRKEVRARRKSTYAKVMAAVTLRATGGTIRGLAAFRRLERKSSGCISGVSNVGEVGEGSEIVWEHVEGDLDIYITQDGHGVSLRKVLEAEIGNYERGEPTKKARVTPAGRKVAPRDCRGRGGPMARRRRRLVRVRLHRLVLSKRVGARA